MRLVPALALLLAIFAAACGNASRQAGPTTAEPPAVTTPTAPTTAPAETPPTTAEPPTEQPPPASTAPADLRPPAVLLGTDAGVQRATQGSACVTADGLTVCGDTGYPLPTRLTVIRPEDVYGLTLETGQFLADPENCTPACPPTLTIRPLGCTQKLVREQTLPADGIIHAILAPGAYMLEVSGAFQTPDGRTGQTWAAAGLLVEPGSTGAIVPATADRFVCPPSDQG